MNAKSRLSAAGLIHAANRYVKGIVRWTLDAANRLSGDALPALVASVVVVEEGGRILFVDRRDGLGLGLPGGLVRWRETTEAAAVREAGEETGLEVVLDGLIGIYSGPNRDPRFSCVQVAYAAHVVGGAARDSEEGAVVWAAVDTPAGRLAFDHARVVADYVGRGQG